MVGRLTAGVAHEMKNPLNAMTIHLELLKQKLAAGKSASQHVEIIGQEIRRLDERIQGFLKFVRPDEAKFGPVAIAPLVSSVLDAVQPEAQRAGVSITRGCADGGLLVEGDAAQLRDAFLNLAQNAIQAMPKGGRLGISCARAAKPARPRARRRYRGRHRAREPDEDFRAVLHDQGTRHRRRFVDGVSDDPDPQRRDRRRIDARGGDDVYRRITRGSSLR